MTKRKPPELHKVPSRYGGKWTKEADTILIDNFSMWLPENVANRINATLGTKFTGIAVAERASQLGLSAVDCQGLVTITDAARQVGICRSALWRFIDRYKLETVGRGHFTFLAEKTWQAIQERYKTPPEPTIGTVEAARRLKYERVTVTEYAEVGKIRAYKFGNRWRISLADVEWLERIQQGRPLIGDTEQASVKRR